MNDIIHDFLRLHEIETAGFDFDKLSADMLGHMTAGLEGEIRSMLMIPTYLSNDGKVPLSVSAAVIDAGGTNFRSALVSFGEDGYEVSELSKVKMPGIDAPCTWQDFIRFTADRIEPLMDRADCIGFCFSYSADITEDMDGIVHCIDKEVVITGAEGQRVGASLIAELESRGIHGKKVVVLNDTVAVLLGGASVLNKDEFGGFIGQVSGTGTNTCVSLPKCRIAKLASADERGMIVNLESGLYDGILGGDFDKLLDEESANPGVKQFEKLTAGVYLGEICRLLLKDAAERGLISAVCAEKIAALGRFDTAQLDAWVRGEGFDAVSAGAGDEAFLRAAAQALIIRSARCMCVNLVALGRLIGAGADRPICVLAEGSLVQKCALYRNELERLLNEVGGGMGMSFSLRVGEDTTLPGAAAAALLNA